jgi:hypothetical protein
VNGLGDQDVGALSVFSSNLSGGTSPTVTIQQVADGVITNSVAFEDAFRSRVGYPNASNQAFYRGQPLFNAGDFPDRVDDLGGAYLTVDPPHPEHSSELSRVRRMPTTPES